MTLILIELLFLFIFLLLVSYFASIETALLSLPQSGISKITEKYPGTLIPFTTWTKHPDNVLAGILIGANLANIGAGVISASLAMNISVFFGNLTLLAVPACVTLAIIFLGEIIPKIYSRYNPDKISRRNIHSVVFFSTIINPLSNILVNISISIMKLLGIYGRQEKEFFSKGDLKFILSQDNELSVDLPKYEKKLLTNILLFSERKVREVMIPRADIFAINYNADFNRVIQDMSESKYSRIPVYKDSVDNIIGVIYTKDLIIVLQERNLLSVEDLIRKVYFVPENVLVKDLLREFKLGKHHISIVVDEYGTTQGLVTIEDLVEEIVGDVYDEYDMREKTIIELPGGAWLVRSSESVDKIEEALNMGIAQNENFSTIGGWALTLFGRIPFTGDKIDYKNFIIEILDSDSRKINRIKITKKPA